MIQDSRPTNKTLYFWVMIENKSGEVFDKTYDGCSLKLEDFPPYHYKFTDIFFPVDLNYNCL